MNALIELGWSVKTVAQVLRVSPTTVYNDLNHWSNEARLSPLRLPQHEVLRRSFKRRTELL